MMIVMDKSMAKAIMLETSFNDGVCLVATDGEGKVWVRSVRDVRKGRSGRCIGSAIDRADLSAEESASHKNNVIFLMESAEDEWLNDVADERSASGSVPVKLEDI